MPSFLIKFTLIAFTAISLSPSSVQGQNVITALQNANAGQFAARIQANPFLMSLLSSNSSPTLFAPVDTAAGQRLHKRSLEGDSFGFCKTLSNASASHKRAPTFPSTDFTTASNLVPANLGGLNQAVVSGAGPTIYAGLGQFVTVVQQFIPFDGGFIHTVTGSLAIPDVLTTTISQISQISTFASLLNSSGLASTLDAVPSSTFFIPDNAAWPSQGSATPNSTIIYNHVVEGFVGYLPSLQDGQVLTTVSGLTLKISVTNGQVFVNNALIVTPNLVLENGVAHVINQVLGTNTTSPTSTSSPTSTTTSSPKAPLFTGGAMSLMTTGFIAVVASTIGSVFLTMLF